MPFGGLQSELEEVTGHKVRQYRQAYLLGIPTLFIYTLVWVARIAEELKAKATAMGIEGPHTSWRHMFLWNMLGCLCFGPMIATERFFNTLNKIETELNDMEYNNEHTTVLSFCRGTGTPPLRVSLSLYSSVCSNKL